MQEQLCFWEGDNTEDRGGMRFRASVTESESESAHYDVENLCKITPKMAKR